MSIHTIKDSILGVPREEDNSTYLIYPQSYPRPHFINHYMLNLWYEADGKTFQKLFEEYQNRYRDVPIEKIQSDIINSIIYLYNLEMVEVTGEGKEVLAAMSKSETSIVNEQDFREINNFILDIAANQGCILNFDYDRNLEKKEVESVYSIPNMRINQIHRKEIYFKIYDSSNVLIGVAGVSFKRSLETCYVSTIILSDLNKFGDVIDELIKVLHSGGINHIKVKTLNKSVVKQLVDNGFEVEARLNDESNDLSITYIVRRNTV